MAEVRERTATESAQPGNLERVPSPSAWSNCQQLRELSQVIAEE